MPDTFPPHSITLEQAMRKIAATFSPGTDRLRVQRFSVEAIDQDGNTLALRWDRLNVGQSAFTQRVPQEAARR